MAIKNELIDELLRDYQKPEDIVGENGLLKQLTKALLERAMNAELTHHLGYEKHDPTGYNSGNSRNGTSAKTLKGDFGEIEIEAPRDRTGSFEPQIAAAASVDECWSAVREGCCELGFTFVRVQVDAGSFSHGYDETALKRRWTLRVPLSREEFIECGRVWGEAEHLQPVVVGSLAKVLGEILAPRLALLQAETLGAALKPIQTYPSSTQPHATPPGARQSVAHRYPRSA
jgi:hypothetical protein